MPLPAQENRDKIVIFAAIIVYGKSGKSGRAKPEQQG